MGIVVIHPTQTHKLHHLVAMQQATGLRISAGTKYLRLTPENPAHLPKKPAVSRAYIAPPTGGDAA